VSNPATAVVVVSYNTRELLLSCLASVVSAAEAARASAVSIVVVDNASSDDSLEAVRQAHCPGGAPTAGSLRVATIANPTNRGFAAACNQAIRATTEPFVLLLNSDAALGSEALVALWRCMESRPRCAAAGCIVRRPDGTTQTTTRHFLTPVNQAAELLFGPTEVLAGRLARTVLPHPGDDSVDDRIDWIDGACLLLRRAALDAVGLLDERFFMYGEDEDLAYRLRRGGWSVCFTAAGAVTHVGGASAARERDVMLRQFYLSQLLLLVKHYGRNAARRFALAMRFALWAKRVARAVGAIDRRPMAEEIASARRALAAAYASRAWIEGSAAAPPSVASASSSTR
jgi:N-acetylglucosaminyl-diphospho-decaprenol L-rhamnosyltransferase